MKIELIEEKVAAIRVAEDCMHTILTIRPDAVDDRVFTLLAELKLDLADIKMEQEFA